MSAMITAPAEENALAGLRQSLEEVEKNMAGHLKQFQTAIERLPQSQQFSAANLVRYLSLRSADLRPLQDNLHIAGLSSLASSESHILRQVQAIQQRLGRIYAPEELSDCDYFAGRLLLQQRAASLFGQKTDESIPYLMVTFDSGFADNFHLVKKLLEAGMNVARINCAHDEVETWEKMIALLRSASEKTGIACKIYMDLPGPKMRTSLLGKGRTSGKAAVSEGLEVAFAEQDADYDPSEVVIGCNEAGVAAQLKAGERVFFDDGLIESEVLSNEAQIARLKILRVSTKKPFLKSEKGINLPDSDLNIPAFTAHDESLIPFICRHADLIGYSFLRHPSGIEALQKLMLAQPSRPGLILKIETPEAVRNFPALLMSGMSADVFGVMIARGDLAVEIGFERMSEIQEEILWISEAAHVPVIWATQVLETLNRSGIATRSEVTDASYAAMAECVMINKGEYVIQVIRTLRDILQRSGAHHAKKRYTFRPMQIAKNFFAQQQSGTQ